MQGETEIRKEIIPENVQILNYESLLVSNLSEIQKRQTPRSEKRGAVVNTINS